MATAKRPPRGKLRGQKAIPHSLDEVGRQTFRLWRKHHLDVQRNDKPQRLAI